MGAGDSS